MVTSIEYPGTGVSIAAILIGVFLIGLAIRLFAYIFGFTINVSGGVSSFHEIKHPRANKPKRN